MLKTGFMVLEEALAVHLRQADNPDADAKSQLSDHRVAMGASAQPG